MDPHLQVASDPADQIGGRPLFAAFGRHRLVRPDLQQQHLVQHHLPELGRELGDELQAGRVELPRVDEVLSEQGEETIFIFIFLNFHLWDTSQTNLLKHFHVSFCFYEAAVLL